MVYEATDCGLLSPELVAGVRQVSGVRKLSSRVGNWLTRWEASVLWQIPDRDTLKGKRDRAILAILEGCGGGASNATAWLILYARKRKFHLQAGIVPTSQLTINASTATGPRPLLMMEIE